MADSDPGQDLEDRVLILAPSGRDGATAAEVLARAGFHAQACDSLDELGAEWDRGASALILAEEALVPGALALIKARISRQPSWSDIPILILTSGGEISQARLRSLNAFTQSGKVILLERPFRLMTFLSTVEMAMRVRRRQYELRKTLADLKDSEERLKSALEELKQGQARLVQAQKMEAIGKLAGGIAHDFNNILTAINGYSEMLLEAAGDDNYMRQGLEEIHRAGERAAALTRQLLAYSRQQFMAFRVLDLNQVVVNIISLLKRLMNEDIVLNWKPFERLPSIEADASQLEQVILNLALNARDAMPKGGELRMETSPLEVLPGQVPPHPELRPGLYARLIVSDNGVGIEEPILHRIFEPFFTTKERTKGTGMGLSTVYGIVKQSGGQIVVESSPGKGSVFTVFFPAAKKKSKAAAPAEPAGNIQVTEGVILVVEDEESVRNFTREFLAGRGFTVLTAREGREALDIAAEYPGEIHLLLTDVIMPTMGGRELAGRLQAMRPGIRVLFISGYTDDAILQHGILEGGAEFMNKPFSLPALLRKVRELLAKPIDTRT